MYKFVLMRFNHFVLFSSHFQVIIYTYLCNLFIASFYFVSNYIISRILASFDQFSDLKLALEVEVIFAS